MSATEDVCAAQPGSLEEATRRLLQAMRLTPYPAMRIMVERDSGKVIVEYTCNPIPMNVNVRQQEGV